MTATSNVGNGNQQRRPQRRQRDPEVASASHEEPHYIVHAWGVTKKRGPSNNFEAGIECVYYKVLGFGHGRKLGEEYFIDWPLNDGTGRKERSTYLLKLEGSVINKYGHSDSDGYFKQVLARRRY